MRSAEDGSHRQIQNLIADIALPGEARRGAGQSAEPWGVIGGQEVLHTRRELSRVIS